MIVGKCTIQHNIIQALVNAHFANYTLKQWKKATMWNGHACKIKIENTLKKIIHVHI
jgi:Holliday junction resolvasome RuvABC endonuclease subunit